MVGLQGSVVVDGSSEVHGMVIYWQKEAVYCSTGQCIGRWKQYIAVKGCVLVCGSSIFQYRAVYL